MSDTTTAGLTPATTPAEGVTPDANTTPNGATPDGNAAQAETIESLPEWAQKLVKDLRKENEKQRQRNADERRQSEEAKLAEQQKWQELATKREQERDAVSAEAKEYKERYEALAAQQRAALTAETAKWPKEVRDLLPDAESADVQVYADAVTKARALVAALTAKNDATPGHGLTPAPVAKAGATAATEEARRQTTLQYRNL